MKKRSDVIKNIIVIAVMIVIVIGFYFAISSENRKKSASKEETQKETGETLLKKDLEKDYPLTPTAVITYYSDLLLAYYDDDCNEDMRVKLVQQSRLLYDEELLGKNTEEDQLISLASDIEKYESNKKQIINYTVCKPEEVEYGELDGGKVALMAASYRIREGSALADIKEEYFLRKDKEGLWKIVGWQEAGSAADQKQTEAQSN